MEPLWPETVVIRIGHRPERDKRVTSHVALVARSFGAKGFVLEGNCDPSVSKTIIETEYYWGKGLRFSVCGVSLNRLLSNLKNKGFTIIHLTMYGLPVDQLINDIRAKKKIAIVIGAEKVPRQVYNEADYNISIGSQPHSEVAALAVFLDRLYNGRELKRKYVEPKVEIEPSERDKRVRKRE